MRKLAADTSVIVPAVFERHPHHESSLALMQRTRRREKGLCSGVVYDAIHYAAATKAQAERLLTHNIRDFYRLCTAPAFVCRPDVYED